MDNNPETKRPESTSPENIETKQSPVEKALATIENTEKIISGTTDASGAELVGLTDEALVYVAEKTAEAAKEDGVVSITELSDINKSFNPVIVEGVFEELGEKTSDSKNPINDLEKSNPNELLAAIGELHDSNAKLPSGEDIAELAVGVMDEETKASSYNEEKEMTNKVMPPDGRQQVVEDGLHKKALEQDEIVFETNKVFEQLFGRNRDRLACEFSIIGLIDGYKRWGVDGKNREIHQEILKAVRDEQIAERKPNELNSDQTIHRMTVILKDGRELSEERTYDTSDPVFDYKKLDSYIKDDVISKEEANDILFTYKVLMGKKLPDNIDVNELRKNVGAAKEKILRHYNKAYQDELFHDDGSDREGLTRETLDDGTKVVHFNGSDFKILAHVRNALYSAQGEMNVDSLLSEDPKHEWEAPRMGNDYIPHGLSTSLISNEKINIYKRCEIIFGFTELRENSIVTMSEEDAGSSLDARSRYAIFGTHGNERLMMPDDLIKKTGSKDSMSSFNEVVLDRFAGDELIMPSCLIVFGDDSRQITDLQKQYAKSFDIPIYLIDESKYGGVRAIGDPEQNL